MSDENTVEAETYGRVMIRVRGGTPEERIALLEHGTKAAKYLAIENSIAIAVISVMAFASCVVCSIY